MVSQKVKCEFRWKDVKKQKGLIARILTLQAERASCTKTWREDRIWHIWGTASSSENYYNIIARLLELIFLVIGSRFPDSMIQ